MSVSMAMYHSLPAFARSIAASAHGYYLGWQRYDRNTEKLVEEALERDYWTRDQWHQWTSNRISFLLNRAATKVPYYRAMWSKRRAKGDRSSYEYLENWPILDKQTLRDHPRAFVADDRDPRRMVLNHTSGTTGTSLRLWSSRETVKRWYALSEARWRRWYGITRKDRWAILGGQLVTPVSQRRPPYWVWNAGLNQLYLSSYHLEPRNLRSYLDVLADKRVKYVLGYTSALATLAQAAKDNNVGDIRLDAVITNAEPIFDHQRALISEAFGCPVRETYGMAEMAAAASECSEGSLHRWPDAGWVEKSSSVSDAPEDFICTGLVNADMPLIRYRIGDSGRLSESVCCCGRTLPLIEAVEGRSDDLLYTKEGRRIGRLDPVFKDTADVIEAQIVQRSLRQIVIRYVSRSADVREAESKIALRLRERLGDIDVKFEEVSRIPRTARGKFRAVVCEIPESERPGL